MLWGKSWNLFSIVYLSREYIIKVGEEDSDLDKKNLLDNFYRKMKDSKCLNHVELVLNMYSL